MIQTLKKLIAKFRRKKKATQYKHVPVLAQSYLWFYNKNRAFGNKNPTVIS